MSNLFISFKLITLGFYTYHIIRLILINDYIINNSKPDPISAFFGRTPWSS